jgi:CHAD domain-containing protein
LWARFAKQFEKHRSRVLRDAPRFFALELPEQHAFRRRLRRLRYLRELALSKQKQVEDPLLKRLLGLQEAMGRYQDRVVASQIVAHLEPSARAAQLGEVLLNEQNRVQKEISAGLKRFLAHNREPGS